MGRLDDIFAAVVAEPDADGPRLVYADELLAMGDRRGELITIQCELARAGCDRLRWAAWQPGGDRGNFVGDAFATIEHARIHALRTREQALLAASGREWSGGIGRTARFSRGFVDHVIAPDVALANRFDRLPLLRSLDIPGQSTGVEVFGARRLQQLSIRLGPQRSEHFLARLGELEHLRELSIAGLVLASEGSAIDRLFASPVMAQLEGIDLVGQTLDTGYRILQLLEIAPIRALRISAAHGPEISSLGRTSRAELLEILDVSMYRSGARLPELASSPYLHNLRALNLGLLAHDCDLAPLGAAFPTLEVLALSHPRIEPLLAGKGLGRLAHLRLAHSRLDDAAIIALATSALFARLVTLDLRDTKLTDDQAAMIVAAAPPSLRVLDVRSNQLAPLSHPHLEILA